MQQVKVTITTEFGRKKYLTRVVNVIVKKNSTEEAYLPYIWGNKTIQKLSQGSKNIHRKIYY